jgi:hypothetical protein
MPRSVANYQAYNPEILAAHLVEKNLPGQRPPWEIRELREERAARGFHTQLPAVTVLDRFREQLVEAATDEIDRRGGETHIQGRGRKVYPLEVIDRDPAQRITLLRAEGWRYYTTRESHRATLAYLYGPDDAGAGPWAVRVSSTLETVAEALDWITPPEVKKALASGNRVLRQGDVYAVETLRRFDGTGDLPEGHEWRPRSRYLIHRPADGRKHRPVKVPFPARFVVQRVYGMGRGAGRANGD